MAVGVIVLTYTLLSLAAVAVQNIELLVLLFGGGAFLFPGAIGGYLTTKSPLLVGVFGALGVYAAGVIVTMAVLGNISVGFLLFSLGSDIAQAAVTCGTAVAAFVLRSRLLSAAYSAVN